MVMQFSEFAQGLVVETAFDVLAVARQLEATGKRVVKLQIGDSPFPSTSHAKQAGMAAIQADHSHYCPSAGLPSLRATVAETLQQRFGVPLTANHVVVGPGAKIFEQFFCEAFLNPGDEVLLFTPQFPTYQPNIQRRAGQILYSALRQANAFRPNLQDVADFVQRPKARAIFLNSPHNPTGGVATKEDIEQICGSIRGKPIALFSDEPYDYMVWQGEHRTPWAEPDMLAQVVSVYTFSKSYSMSGWRIGFAVSAPENVEILTKLINTSLSCVPPFVQLAAESALRSDAAERDEVMDRFRRKVELLVTALQQVPDVTVAMPAGTFYVFPNVMPICNRLQITSHGLAMYLLEGADDAFGVACLGGECFGAAGGGFLRFSCAEPDEALTAAVQFLPEAWSRTDRIQRYLEKHPRYRLANPYVA